MSVSTCPLAQEHVSEYLNYQACSWVFENCYSYFLVLNSSLNRNWTSFFGLVGVIDLPWSFGIQTKRLRAFVIVENTEPCEFKPRGEMGGETEILIFTDFTAVFAVFVKNITGGEKLVFVKYSESVFSYLVFSYSRWALLF